jgi:hypothetical protein
MPRKELFFLARLDRSHRSAPHRRTQPHRNRSPTIAIVSFVWRL